ncbi:MAG: hypothetical protein K0U98_17645 [Deltaproteobacteria bacterium]|nr:hypothetical protein [Deltaproteobacteria bacterium]
MKKSIGLLLLLLAMFPASAVLEAGCLPSSDWINHPSSPADIPAGSDNCAFHQFAWQEFLYLVSPSEGTVLRKFENRGRHPIYGVDLCPVHGEEPALEGDDLGLLIRTRKVQEGPPNVAFLPSEIKQAGSNEPLYDQKGNVTYYNTRFTWSECSVQANTGDAGLPSDTIELKTAWRKVDQAEAHKYYTVMANFVNEKLEETPTLLGLIGFHIAKITKNHPEMVWITFEHKDNAPVCDLPQHPPVGGWSFTSAQCAACLARPYSGGCMQYLGNHCSFNVYRGDSRPANVCLRSANGGGSLENQQNIQSLNEKMVGPGGYLSSLPSSNPLSVFQNYFHVGTLWMVNGQSELGPWLNNGSLSLLNSVLETFVQNVSEGGGTKSSQNCFSCHVYNGPANTAALSHIIPISDSLETVEANAGLKKKRERE